jgi:hypothetical protein
MHAIPKTPKPQRGDLFGTSFALEKSGYLDFKLHHKIRRDILP